MVNVERVSHATSRWTYRVLLGVLFKRRLNGWDYTASIVDEIHMSMGRWLNDTAMDEQKVLGHTTPCRSTTLYNTNINEMPMD